MHNDLFDLQGKTALITGAAGLLGKQHAIALLAKGATVVLSDINEASLTLLRQELSTHYSTDKVLYSIIDVTNKSSIEQAQQSLLEKNISIDILINNAAIDPKVNKENDLLENSRFENFPLSDWQLQLDVGLTGAFLCSQVFGVPMAQRKKGVILNIASDLSVIAPDQRLYRKPSLPEDKQAVKPVTYSVIKTALIGLTRYLAAYWADKNVRVNALSPGGVFAGQDEAFVLKLCQLIPAGRMANIDEYHGAIQFLCSDASLYMTGQNIVIDGGRSIL